MKLLFFTFLALLAITQCRAASIGESDVPAESLESVDFDLIADNDTNNIRKARGFGGGCCGGGFGGGFRPGFGGGGFRPGFGGGFRPGFGGGGFGRRPGFGGGGGYGSSSSSASASASSSSGGGGFYG